MPIYEEEARISREDLEREALLEWLGTLINPAIKLTDRGMEVAAQLRQHKANGGQFREFVPAK